jgi:hypothetical protein
MKSGQVPSPVWELLVMKGLARRKVWGASKIGKSGPGIGQAAAHRTKAVVICQQQPTPLPVPASCFGFFESRLSYRLSILSSLSRTSTAVAHISHTPHPHAHPYLPPNMSARQQQMGRPGGARFAQFKLVLLGMPNLPSDTLRFCMLTMFSQASPPSERCATAPEAYQHMVQNNESNTPQSSLVLRFVKDQFDDYRESTIGAAFLTQTIALDDTTTVKFEIWDTAGQERYKSLAPMYYRNANCAVVVYDITQAVRSTLNSQPATLY